MNLEEFKKIYATTLDIDNEGTSYAKLPIYNLYDLGCMQQSLLKGLQLLTEIDEEEQDLQELKNIINSIGRVLLAINPQSELEGLSRWLNTK